MAPCLVLTVLRFVVDINVLFILPDLLVFAAWLMYAIGSKDIVLNNKVAKYLSGISMEIYLCDMMFYRVASMLHLERFIHDNNMLYVATCITILIGAICFSHVVKYYVFLFMENKYDYYMNKEIGSSIIF